MNAPRPQFNTLFPLLVTSHTLSEIHLQSAFAEYSKNGILDISGFKQLIEFLRIVDRLESPLSEDFAQNAFINLFGFNRVTEELFLANFNRYWSDRKNMYTMEAVHINVDSYPIDSYKPIVFQNNHDREKLRALRVSFLKADKQRTGRIHSNVIRDESGIIQPLGILIWSEFANIKMKH
jgi:hypothetical protein